ncbi:hypothetical protein CYLTODRAFT_451501 [Cylindrobasidium torrendii FP15055 ss-10]|uniref:Uncharacterized protein n=1 Tax=Cylindrobasidium torrendii FP15055 ss-10 TaxID=1314674 RepID=A0A0D7BKL7_9AGAR|nr:hypothetical protein CYLTODRAFT_451501 [Cylindrobasidium torrendii FP15055 ss-10]
MRTVPIGNTTPAWNTGLAWQIGQNCAVYDRGTRRVHVYTCIRAHYSSLDTVPIPLADSPFWQYIGLG